MPSKQQHRRLAENDMTERFRADPVFAIAQVAVLVKIMLTVLLLDPRSFDTFTLPKSVAAHATSLVIAALLVWLVARHGRALLFWSPLHVGAGALLLAFTAATPSALDQTVALFGTFKRYLGLTQMLDNVLLYLAVGVLFRDIRSLRLLTGVSIGVVVPVLGYALVQRLGLDPLTFRQAETRIPISTMGNPDLAGAFVAVIGVSAVGFGLLLGGGRFAWYRMALGAIGLACVGILYATGVRAGLLAMGAGWTAVVLLSFASNTDRRRTSASLGGAVILVVAVFLSPIAARLDPQVLLSDPAFISRMDIWTAAVRALAERPLLGLGPDNFVAAYPSHRTGAGIKLGLEALQNSTHDIWLYAATSAGVVGLASLLVLVALAAYRGIRLARSGHPAALALVPLAAYLGQALVSVNEIVIDWIFWTSLGVIASGATASLGVARRQVRSEGRPLVGVVALLAAAVIAVFTVAPRIVGGEALLAAEAYANAGVSPAGVAWAQTAISVESRRGEYWSSYGSALHKAGEITAAMTAFQVAAERQPWHPLSWRNLAAVWTDLGNPSAAYATAKRIPLTDTYDGDGRQLLAEIAYEQGDFARAAAEGERAIVYQLDPGRSVYFTTISAYVQLRQLDRAEALGREATAKFPTDQLRLQLAAILADQGKTAEALSLLDGLLREDPKNADAQRLRDALQAK